MLNTELDVEDRSVHVAVGVIVNERAEVLIALRKPDQHQGGLWEFPGGKLEQGETTQKALIRELEEELGILAVSIEPLIKVSHTYSDKSVVLDVSVVSEFHGKPRGREGQETRWVAIDSLSDYQFPKANLPIVKAILLPSLVAINGEFTDRADFLMRADRAIESGAGLFQLRLPSSNGLDSVLFEELKNLCRLKNVKLVVNSSVCLNDYSEHVGLHLRSQDLMSLTDRPVGQSVLLGASCHNAKELHQAQLIGVDYVFLSPIKHTQSHVNSKPIGWNLFSELVTSVNVPAYALGGLQKKDMYDAKVNGAQGIAAISALWG